jgi:hypothetical protein
MMMALRDIEDLLKSLKAKKKSDIKLGTEIIVNQWLILVINGL